MSEIDIVALYLSGREHFVARYPDVEASECHIDSSFPRLRGTTAGRTSALSVRGVAVDTADFGAADDDSQAAEQDSGLPASCAVRLSISLLQPKKRL